jgi:long-subunit fatty acid transport protein
MGGLNKFEIGFGWKLNDQISIGYAPSVAFFSMETSEAFSFSSSLYSQQKQKLNISGAAFSQRLGVAGSFRNVFKTQDKISVGATINVPFSMTLRQDFTTEKETETGSKTVDLSNILSSKKGEMSLPLEYAAGIGYAPHPRFNVSIEGQYQQWSDYSNDLVDNDGAVMADRMRIGLGAQFHPYKKAQSGFFSSFKYSAGLSYDSGHLTIQEEEIRTLWLHTGLGILSRSPSSIDVSVRYGFRGTTESNLIEENIWAIGLSVNLAEIMFLRPKLQ